MVVFCRLLVMKGGVRLGNRTVYCHWFKVGEIDGYPLETVRFHRIGSKLFIVLWI